MAYDGRERFVDVVRPHAERSSNLRAQLKHEAPHARPDEDARAA
jgi:hypothetical protein